MIRHTVIFRFKEEISQAARETLLAEYESFPKLFPKMKNFGAGKNISNRDDTFEYGFSVEFDSEEDLLEYLSSTYHEEHVTQRFRPLIADRAIFSYRTD
jgi:2,3-dihydroxy-p-cumate/2,3-dihydroxybenzoate 3,4-dioxygenase